MVNNEHRVIRILYVDDSRLDRQLVREALADEPNLRLTETVSRDDFLARLRSEPYDLVLSDFNILGFLGLDVIASVHEIVGDTPVVIVTGTGNEEIAVEAMKRGAADYVIKSPTHIRRLPITISTAIEQRTIRRERERLQGDLDRFFRLCREMLCVLDREGHFRRINPAFEETLGFPLDDLIGRDLFVIVDAVDLEKVRAEFARLRNLAATQFVCRCVTRDGRCRSMDWIITPSPDGDVLYATVRDVTERLVAEEEERRKLIVKERVSQLSVRERAVLTLVVQGLPNKTIAQKMNLSEKTIEKYRSRGMKKLKITSVADLVRLAVSEGVF